MTEPRTRLRPKGQQFPSADLEAYLHAFGGTPSTPSSLSQTAAAPPPPLPSTIATLDEIVTDFIIETCHLASVSAVHAHRQKIKVEDFKFMLRRDPRKLGRVIELLKLDRDIRRRRRVFEVDEDAGGVKAAANAGGLEDEEGEGGGKKRGRKRRKKNVTADEDAETGTGAGSVSKVRGAAGAGRAVSSAAAAEEGTPVKLEKGRRTELDGALDE